MPGRQGVVDFEKFRWAPSRGPKIDAGRPGYERNAATWRRDDSTGRERAEAVSEFADLALAHVKMRMHPKAIC